MSITSSSTESECNISPWAKWGFYEPDDYVVKGVLTGATSTTENNTSKSVQTAFSGLAFRPKEVARNTLSDTTPSSTTPGLVFRGKPSNAIPQSSSPPEAALPHEMIPSATPAHVSKSDDPADTPRFCPLIRIMLDEICVTPSLKLEDHQWSLLDFFYVVPTFHAPQAYTTLEAGILDWYLLAQVTSTKGNYAKLQFMRFSSDEVHEFDSHIKHNVTQPGMEFKIEIHFGKADDAAFLKEVWVDQSLDCWPGEEAFLHSDHYHIWVPREGEDEPDLKEMSKAQVKQLKVKQEASQPSTVEWFPMRKVMKQKKVRWLPKMCNRKQHEDCRTAISRF